MVIVGEIVIVIAKAAFFLLASPIDSTCIEVGTYIASVVDSRIQGLSWVNWPRGDRRQGVGVVVRLMIDSLMWWATSAAALGL